MTKERQIFLLKLGFFPVTDDFWQGSKMPMAVGQHFTWAFRMQKLKQEFMPFHEEFLIKKTDDELRIISWKLLNGEILS